MTRYPSFVSTQECLTLTIEQLRSLEPCSIGALIGVVIPPARITTRDKGGIWPAKVANTPLFSFCHNDLAQHNVLIKEDTLQVEAITDWELSGYYPPEFEAPLWTMAWNEPGYHDIVLEADKLEDLIYFLSDTSQQKRPRRESCTNFDQTPCQSSQIFQDTKRMDRLETLALKSEHNTKLEWQGIKKDRMELRAPEEA